MLLFNLTTVKTVNQGIEKNRKAAPDLPPGAALYEGFQRVYGCLRPPVLRVGWVFIFSEVFR